VMRQWLKPLEGWDAVIFPSTYAKPQKTNEGKDQNEEKNEKEWLGYNIDGEGASSVCQIDSVGSQANRMEPIFKRGQYKQLIPQIRVQAAIEGIVREIDLLDAGHRAADAIVRFSELGTELYEAFRTYCDKGNAEPLAKIAPTSIVFGVWDSRATQAKLPRVVRSVIRAYNVRVLHRSAQYSTIAGEILAKGDVKTTAKGLKAELGLTHVPAAWTHGGVQVLGEIRRDAILKLATIRALAAQNENGEDTSFRLRRYILGLALVSFTAPQEGFLREGCELVTDPKQPIEWKSVKHDGTEEDFTMTHDKALSFATASAEEFGVHEAAEKFEDGVRTVAFCPDLVEDIMTLKEDERKELLKQGPITKEIIEKFKKSSASKGKTKEQLN